MIARKLSLRSWFLLAVVLLTSGFLSMTGCKESNNTMPSAGLISDISGIGTYGSSSGTATSTTVAPSATGSGVDLTGKVYDAAVASLPISGAKITFDQKVIGQSSSIGEYFLSAVQPGNHNVTIEKEDYESFSFFFSVAKDFSGINVPGVAMQRKTYTFRGKVLSQDSKKTPIEGAIVAITELGSSTTTTSAGEFTFPAIKSGIYNLVAKTASSSFSQTTSVVEIKKDGTISPSTVEILLPPNNFSLSGYVKLNTSREGLPNINTDIWAEDNLLASTTTTGEGKFFFQNLSAGRYDLVVATNSTEFQSTSYGIQILSDGTVSPANPEVFLTRRGQTASSTVHGTIRDAYSNGPLEYVTCKITGFGQVLSDSSGGFTFKNLPPGSYQLEFSKQGFNTLSISFSLADDPTFVPPSLDYELIYNQESGKGSIAGRFYDEKNIIGEASATVRVYPIYNITKTYRTATYTYSFTHWEINDTAPIKSTGLMKNDESTKNDETGTFKITHLPPSSASSKYVVYIGTGTAELQTIPGYYESFVDVDNNTRVFTWRVLNPLSGNYVHSWTVIDVTSDVTTYLSNYEKAN